MDEAKRRTILQLTDHDIYNSEGQKHSCLKTELPVQTLSQPPHEGNFIRKLMVLFVMRAQHCGVSGVCAEVRR